MGKTSDVEYTHPSARIALLAALAPFKARALDEGDVWLAKRLHALEGDVLGDHEQASGGAAVVDLRDAKRPK